MTEKCTSQQKRHSEVTDISPCLSDKLSDLLFKDGHYEINITESDLYDLIYSPLYFVLLQDAFQKGSEICVSPNQGNYTDV